MGSEASKEESSKTIGDQTVTIVENQEVHTSFLEDHAWKLNVILCPQASSISNSALSYKK